MLLIDQSLFAAKYTLEPLKKSNIPEKFMKHLILVTLFMVCITGCSKNDLHDAMESMGSSFKTMRDSDEIAALKSELDTFTTSYNIAKKQQIKAEDQSTFNEGMKELNQLLTQLKTNIDAGDVQKSKELLKQLGKVRKKYHEKLGVK